MLNPECLNPKDVLAHLHSLGYHDISPQQLKEFIHDLKKLIKYDQKKSLRECVEPQDSSPCSCSCPDCFDHLEKLSSNESYCESSTSRSTSPTSVTFSSDISRRGKLKKCSGRNTTESDLPQTTHTSFIKPWNLQGCRDYSNKRRKNLDPVRLYHQYKDIWKNQNIPGESKHSELRWIIRNKMVGQEPHPKVFISNPKYFS